MDLPHITPYIGQVLASSPAQPSFKNHGYYSNKGDEMGVQKQFVDLIPGSYLFDSDFILSESTISIKCVRFLMWIPSTFESIHFNNSGDNLTPMYSFTISNTILHCNTNENINTCITITNNVLQCKTISEGDKCNERSESAFY